MSWFDGAWTDVQVYSVWNMWDSNGRNVEHVVVWSLLPNWVIKLIWCYAWVILNIHMTPSSNQQTIFQWVALNCFPETVFAINWALFLISGGQRITLRTIKCFLISVKSAFLILLIVLTFWIFYALNDSTGLFQSMPQMLLLYGLWFESSMFWVAASAGAVSHEEALIFRTHSRTSKIVQLLLKLWNRNSSLEGFRL